MNAKELNQALEVEGMGEFIQAHVLKRENGICAARIACKDGFSLSVQASRHHYCAPCADKGPYTAFEVGSLSLVEPLLAQWDEGSYGQVPLDIVVAVLVKHGGPV
jgi:hypothetical protein